MHFRAQVLVHVLVYARSHVHSRSVGVKLHRCACAIRMNNTHSCGRLLCLPCSVGRFVRGGSEPLVVYIQRSPPTPLNQCNHTNNNITVTFELNVSVSQPPWTPLSLATTNQFAIVAAAGVDYNASVAMDLGAPLQLGDVRPVFFGPLLLPGLFSNLGAVPMLLRLKLEVLQVCDASFPDWCSPVAVSCFPVRVPACIPLVHGCFEAVRGGGSEGG